MRQMRAPRSDSAEHTMRWIVNDDKKTPTQKNAGPGGKGVLPPRRPLSGRTWLITLIVVLLFDVLFYAPFVSTSSTPQTSLTYSQFLSQIKANNIATAQVSADSASGNFTKTFVNPTDHK